MLVRWSEWEEEKDGRLHFVCVCKENLGLLKSWIWGTEYEDLYE